MNETKTIFFGIMIGDLFADDDGDINHDKSVRKYAKMCEDAIVSKFAKYGEHVEVDWDSQNVGGAIPNGLRTRVDGKTSGEDVEMVDEVISDVWNEWEWIVYND